MIRYYYVAISKSNFEMAWKFPLLKYILESFMSIFFWIKNNTSLWFFVTNQEFIDSVYLFVDISVIIIWYVNVSLKNLLQRKRKRPDRWKRDITLVDSNTKLHTQDYSRVFYQVISNQQVEKAYFQSKKKCLGKILNQREGKHQN